MRNVKKINSNNPRVKDILIQNENHDQVDAHWDSYTDSYYHDRYQDVYDDYGDNSYYHDEYRDAFLNQTEKPKIKILKK